MPGVGPLLVAGPLVLWIVSALQGAVVVGGLSALGGALASIGIPENNVVQFETEVKNGRLLLVAHGTADEVERARDLLHEARATSTVVHAVPVNVEQSTSVTVQIEVEGRDVPFRLDRASHRWHSASPQKESDFPLISVADGKRCELYSDGTFAEVAR